MSDVDLFGVEARAKRSLSTHETTATSTDEWLTPPALIHALGPFDLDPCSPGDRRPWEFLKGRLRFCYVTGKEAGAAGAPSVLVAYGERDAEVLASGALVGHYVSLARDVA